jgi:hypothetical protein
MVSKGRNTLSSSSYAACRVQLLLSAVYVFGCAFRSVLPVFDVPRLAVFETWFSSVIMGRSVATLAEVCFAIQWALMLSASARVTRSATAGFVSRVVVPLILIAEVCSWYSVLTTSNLGHVAEETIWGFSGFLLLCSMAAMWPRCASNWRPALFLGCLVAATYVAFMFVVDVPMYWARWTADQASGRQYMSLGQGFLEITQRSAVSRRWEDWSSELIWMSLYFSVAVWISISLVYAFARGFADQKPVTADASLIGT